MKPLLSHFLTQAIHVNKTVVPAITCAKNWYTISKATEEEKTKN